MPKTKFSAQFATIAYLTKFNWSSETLLAECLEAHVKLQMGVVQPNEGQEINPKEYQSLQYNKMADWYSAT